MTFENGWTVSVQFGGGNYCDNYNAVEIGGEKHFPTLESSDAEVACWPPFGDFLPFEDGEDIAPRQSPAQVLEILNRIAALPKAGSPS